MRVLMAGGGTGGHLIPALNIARELLARADGDVRFVGTARGLENKVVPNEGFPLTLLPVVPLSRRPSGSWLKFPFALFSSISKTVALIREMDAQVVVATGGYVAGPAIIAGWLTRRPVVLCEQNSFPGLTSRAGSLFARKVCLGLPGAKGHLWRKSKATLTGNPVAIKPPAMTATEIKAKFGLKRELPMVLITGGSQGAASINRAVVEMIESSGLPSGVQLLWQTGAGKEDEIKAELSSCPERVSIVPFISPMSEAYVIANIVVARCGALTLSEIAAFGLPALLVPYPYATADHQRRNAEAFSEAGAAIVVQDSEISGDTFREVILELMSDEERRKQMAEASKKLGRPEALKEIVDIIENLAVSG